MSMHIDRIKEVINRYLNHTQGKFGQLAINSWLDSLKKKTLPQKHDHLEDIRHATWQHIEQECQQLTKHKVLPWQRLWRAVGTVAAVLLMASVLLQKLNDTQDIKYNTNSHETRTIHLSDGSSVHLGNNSQLIVPKDFPSSSLREVVLTKGEGFFQVKRDSTRPFIVNNEWMKTEVIGTSFHIRTQQQPGTWNIHVQTGKVKVYSSEENNKHYILLANDSLSYEQHNHKIYYAHQAPALQEDLIFQGEDLQTVAKKLTARYKREIQLAEDISEHHQFSGQFSANEPFASILDIICIATGTQYELRGDTIILVKK